MIRKLKIRFILTTLLAVLLVLVLMMGTINLLNFRSVVRDADELLVILAENGGEMPDMKKIMPPQDDIEPPAKPDGEEWPEDAFSTADGQPYARDSGDSDAENGSFAGQERLWGDRNGGIFRRRNLVNEETPFESRYFAVTADAEGNIQSVSTQNIAAVSSSEARSYAEEVLSGEKTKGFKDDYRYYKDDTDDGQIVVFLNCMRSLENARSFLRASLLVALSAFAVVALMVVLVSGRVLKPVAESYQKQKGFITDAGHELKTPVAVIEADAAVLEMEIGENEWVDDIKKQTRRLAELTGELTYLARMDEGRTDTVRIEFPISDVVLDTAESFRSRAKLAGKEFSVDAAPMLSYTGDEAQIRKLTSILLDNAVKYCPEKGAIRLKLCKKNKNIVLSVANTAEQVDEEMLSHMFDRFYRGDKSRSGENGGFGLGLSIASSIVTAHRGTISARAAGPEEIEITAVL